MPLSLADVYAGLGGQQTHPALQAVTISQFQIDSRRVTPGSAFIALPGEHTDGHRYIDAAIANGAIAIIAERPPDASETLILRPAHDPAPDAIDSPLVFLVDDSLTALQELARYWRNLHNPVVIGITGSVGKTSTKELTAAVLRQRFTVLWNEGNLNNEIGLPLTLLRLTAEHEFAVLEMGFYVEGEISLLCDLAKPSIGIVTNIGPMHLERAGSMEAIFRGKSELVQALPAEGHAILNWDDAWVQKMAGLSPAAVLRYGLNPEADLWADEIVSGGLEGIRFRFHQRSEPDKTETLHVHLPLLGRHSVHTALAAAATGLLAGMVWEDIVNGLHDINAQLRIELVRGIHESTIIDDTYNASPPSTIAALNLLEDMPGRRIAVLGDMLELGDYTEIGHRLAGRRAADVVHTLITVGPLARIIAEEALAGGLPSSQVHHVLSADEAQQILGSVISPGDYILIKGSRALGLDALVAGVSEPTLPR
ncbi:MAG: UDP-N-acetylmuramoyl-tripeptide--D-alanyl-D-alanine ligase [Caldilineales bacterium]|nr:UDP-N-acetylmuramoyl-tripeptide--D-alanyl-D-alanine ligase [Caldilineales bacterium]